MMSSESLMNGNMLDIGRLKELLKKPEPFSPGEELFWDDPHISKGMLEAHLNPTIDAASRKPETIEMTVKNLIDAAGLKPGDKVLDLGCGPGLYSKQFAQHGFKVTGLDYSRRSIDFALEDAKRNNIDIEYQYMNYLKMEYEDEFDAVILIYGDFCVLPDASRNLLLDKIYKALKTNGHFMFDVTTRVHRSIYGLKNGWHAEQHGFWKPVPHLVLESGFDYPDESIYLDQYVVIEESGNISVYRNWFHDYSMDEITQVLQNGGFTVVNAWSDLTGKPYAADSEWIGISAVKK